MATATDLGDVVALMLQSLALNEASMRCSFIWAGTEWPCSGGPEFGGKKLEAGGNRLKAKLTIKVRVEIFPDGIDIPQEHQTIQYKRNASAIPKTYRIEAVTNSYGAWLEIHCEDPNAGA